MPCCSVYGCKSGYPGYHSQQKYQAFTFPKDEKIRGKWIERLNRANFEPTDASVVCAKHFTPDSFGSKLTARGEKRKKLVLEKFAIPSLYLKPDGMPRLLYNFTYKY